ncbi:hypothetical protein ZWY2020_054451 [Hordeum vulgare]|nr:hypothetical protein ZWY2020_054451 [Hordeum vulgare]
MAPRLWLLLLLVAGGLLQARAQSDNKGFISIDCGLQGEESYIDEETKLVYVSDAGFTDAGTNYNISAEYVGPRLSKNVHNLRSFPDGERNCYTLQPLVSGHKYLIRATFLYGNYDGLNRRPATFDLYIGVNFWTAVNMSSRVSKDQGDTMMVEALIVVLDDVAGRVNTGPIDQTIIRYPDDPYDRLWYPWFDPTNYAEMSTTESLTANTKDLFDAPMAVMQTAITPQNASGNLEIYWAAETQPNYPTPGYIAIFHFAELQVLDSSNAELRQFNIYLNDYTDPWHAGYTPDYLYMNFIYSKAASRESSYNFSIEATADSTLPPILNAFEVFSVIPTTNLGTDFQDDEGSMSNTTIIKLLNKEEISTGHADDSDSLRLVENRRFTYKELEVITHGFERVLGQGGFGHVYDGFMEDGTHVAVKLRSHSSNQGVKEFSRRRRSKFSLETEVWSYLNQHKSAILSEPEPTNIIHWVRQRLTRGNIEGVVDAQMHGGYNVNGVWKVAEIALKCTAQASAQRPTMADVVVQLQECVELEESLTQDFNTGGSNIDSSWNYNGYGSGQSTDVSSNATFETELRIPTVPLGPGPVAR